MRQRIAIGALVVLVVAVIAGFVGNAMASSDPGSGPARTIAVSGTATVSTSPDEAVVSLGVRSQADQSAAALDQTQQRMNAVIAALRSSGLAKGDIQTTSITLNHQTVHRGGPWQKTVYASQMQVTAKIDDLSKVGSTIDAAVHAGADQVQNIRFQLADEAAARERALRQAVEGAREKAGAMAESAGASVGGVQSIREQGVESPPVYAQRAPLAQAFGTEGAAAIVPPHDVQTRVTVDVVWNLT